MSLLHLGTPKLLLLKRKVPNILLIAILLQLQICIHDQILPLIDLLFDIFNLRAIARATQKQRLHQNVAGARADTVVFSEHQLAQGSYGQWLHAGLDG